MQAQDVKILIVDDDEISRIGCERILEVSDYKVDLAENGLDGLEKIKSSDYDLVVTDLMMPKMGGMEFLQEIRKVDEKIVPIVITGYATIENAVDAVKMGAYDYLAKPFTPDEFRTKVERALEKRRLLLETEQLRQERDKNMLEHSIEKSRTLTIVNCMSEGVIATNTAGQILLMNPAAVKMLRLKHHNVIGKKVTGLLSNTDLEEKISAALKKVTSCEILERFEVTTGEGRVLQPNITPIINEKGECIGTVAVLIDVTEEKKIEKMKADFLNLVSHELKAPLGAIEGYLNIILDGVTAGQPEKEKSFISKSRDRAHELLDLVNDLLDLTRAERKISAKVMSPVDVNTVLMDTFEFYKNEAKTKSINYTIDLTAALPKIRGNREELSRLFANLVSNAIKYTPAKGQVLITTESNEKQIYIAIKDTGIGMSKEDAAKVFDEFYRAGNAVAKKISGTGLGLAIAKKIVEEHNGYIEVESELEKGSTFTVILPVIIDSTKKNN
ncbi:MAG TPA: response regulator [bacterium]|nr:response regulator [bacterium]HPN43385.1 response regulator [bacterium]